MKIRCVENSIRLRLKKSEVAKLHDEGQVAESVSFPNGVTFRYQLLIASEIATVQAGFKDNTIAIYLPKDNADQWILTNEVGIEVSLPLENERSLRLLIEKDFPCIDRPNEDKSDTFFELVPDQPDNC